MIYKLPPLPEPSLHDGVCVDAKGKYRGTFEGFTVEQTQAYALAAIEAQGVPDGWQLVPKAITPKMAASVELVTATGVGQIYEKLLASAPPAPQANPQKRHACDDPLCAVCGHGMKGE